MSRTFAVVLALSFVPLSAPAFAETNAENAACRRDALHLCRGITEDWRVRDCLVAQKPRLSRGCRAVLEGHGF